MVEELLCEVGDAVVRVGVLVKARGEMRSGVIQVMQVFGKNRMSENLALPNALRICA
jgi:hypothetical protein